MWRLTTGDRAGSDVAVTAIQSIPPSFEANIGQAPADVRFQMRNGAYRLLLDEQGSATYLTANAAARPITMRLSGAQPAREVVGEEPLRAHSNYYFGRDPEQWRLGAPHYGRVRYDDVYPGIDLAYHNVPGRVEYDWVVGPGADPGRVAIELAGADSARISDDGELLLASAGFQVRHGRPVAYQMIDGLRHEREARFNLDSANRLSFVVGDYDRRHALVIDPTVTFSATLAGVGEDVVYDLDVDADGNVVIAGKTSSLEFPGTTPGVRAGRDAFIAKLDPQGELLYVSFFGGADEDEARAVTQDGDGGVFFTGSTRSADYPLSDDPVQSETREEDMVVSRLNSSGEMIFSTLIGGPGVDAGRDITLGRDGRALVTGFGAEGFPLVAPFSSPTYGGGPSDAVVAKLSNSGSTLVFSAAVGSVGADRGLAIDTDPIDDHIYLAGLTTSPDFVSTQGAAQQNLQGGADAFVVRLTPNGQGLRAFTYLGGAADEGEGPEGAGVSMVLDGTGHVAVGGVTRSVDFPTTAGALNPNSPGGMTSGFISRLRSADLSFAYSTYIGGLADDSVASVTADGAGSIYATGSTDSMDFPVTVDAQQPVVDSQDAFVAKLNPQGDALHYSVRLGAEGAESGHAIAQSLSGGVMVGGVTDAEEFAVPAAVAQALLGENTNIFVAQVDSVTTVSAADF